MDQDIMVSSKFNFSKKHVKPQLFLAISVHLTCNE